LVSSLYSIKKKKDARVLAIEALFSPPHFYFFFLFKKINRFALSLSLFIEQAEREREKKINI
jgi:hypothetical protein